MSAIQSNYETDTLVVANGATTSGSVLVKNPTSLGLLIPTITSATVKVQVSNDGTNFFDVQDTAGVVKMTWGASTGNFAVQPADLASALGYLWVQIVCGAPQGAARTFTLIRCTAKSDPLA